MQTIPALLESFRTRLESSPLGLRLARSAYWSLVGGVGARGLGLCVSILVARILGKRGYGELGAIQTTVAMFATLAGLGLGLTAAKYVAELRQADPGRAGRIIALSIAVAWITGGVMAAVLFSTAPLLSTRALAAPHLGESLRISSLLLLLGAVDGAQTGAIAGLEAFRRVAVVSLLASAAAVPLTVGGVWSFGLRGAVLGLVATQALSCLLSFRALRAEAKRHRIPLAAVEPLRESRVLWEFSIPAVASSLLVGPVYWICSAMLVNQKDGYAEMGLFNAANQWFAALLFLPGVLGQAAVPVLAERSAQGDRRGLRKVLSFYVAVNAAIVVPLAAVGSLASSHVMALYGDGFRHGWATLTIVLLTAALVAIQTPVGQAIAALGRMWLGTLMNLGWAVCFALATWVLLPWGALGLAGARLAAYLVHLTWTSAFALLLLGLGRRASGASR